MMNQKTVLSIIENSASKNSSIDVIWLYGTRVKDTANKDSDFDIAIAFNTEKNQKCLTIFQCDEIAFEWSENTGATISIIDINHIPVPLAYSVINEGKVIVCKHDLRLHSEQQRVWSLWESYRYEYKQHRK